MWINGELSIQHQKPLDDCKSMLDNVMMSERTYQTAPRDVEPTATTAPIVESTHIMQP